jgi:hypothetical protein
LIRKTQPLPVTSEANRPISRPATAGPTTRPRLKLAALSETAFCRSSAPTISATKLCLAGVSAAVTTPSSSAKA